MIEAAALVEDCVQYVPAAVYFGNFYMKVIWDLGGGTTEGLREVCESMVTSDPAGLQRMSEEYHALQAFVEPLESSPGSLEQDCVTYSEAGSLTFDVLTLSLHSHHHKVAAGRGLAGEHVLADDW